LLLASSPRRRHDICINTMRAYARSTLARHPSTTCRHIFTRVGLFSSVAPHHPLPSSWQFRQICGRRHFRARNLPSFLLFDFSVRNRRLTLHLHILPPSARSASFSEYLTYCHHMGVSDNRFATHERRVNVRGLIDPS
jgi:hypothetical protein